MKSIQVFDKTQKIELIWKSKLEPQQLIFIIIWENKTIIIVIALFTPTNTSYDVLGRIWSKEQNMIIVFHFVDSVIHFFACNFNQLIADDIQLCRRSTQNVDQPFMDIERLQSMAVIINWRKLIKARTFNILSFVRFILFWLNLKEPKNRSMKTFFSCKFFLNYLLSSQSFSLLFKFISLFFVCFLTK